MRVSIPRLDVTQSRTLSSSKLRFLFTILIVYNFQSKYNQLVYRGHRLD